jgi:hypothetical protein
MHLPLQIVYDTAMARLGQIKADLHWSGNKRLRKRHLGKVIQARLRSTVYVWIPAVIEQYLVDLVAAILHEINSQSIPIAQIKVSLLSHLANDRFKSIRDIKDIHTAWRHRINIFHLVEDVASATFDETVVPSDGHTPKADHIKLIWEVFGIRGSSFPDPVQDYELYLSELARLRNSLVHGRADPEGFGRQRTPGDLLAKIAKAEAIITHITGAVDDYLQQGGFRR